MKLLITLIIIAILYWYFNSKKEAFTQFAPINWTSLSKSRCQELKNDMKDIETTLQACNATNHYGQRDNINNKVACIDAVNRQIFNTRESSSWCASAEPDKKSNNANELLGAQPTDVVNTIAKIDVPPKPVVEVTAEVEGVKVEVAKVEVMRGGILENNFNLLENVGFNGTDVSKTFAAY